MADFTLMHKDLEVCYFKMDGDQVLGAAFSKEYMGHVPFSVKDKHSLQKWLVNRAIPATRIGIRSITSNSLQFMLSNYGLSLSDCYWVKPFGETCVWGDVNFFDHDFHSTNVLDNFTELNVSGRISLTPSASLKGDLQKKWIIVEGKRVLIKGNYGNTALQSVAEVLASSIYRKQQVIPFTSYDFCKIRLNGTDVLGCACEDFATQELEFVPAIDIINSLKKSNDRSYYQMFVGECLKHGINSVESFMSNMFLVDFYMVNQDRHMNNFGILRNPDTLEWVSMAPVFDTGNSMFYSAAFGTRLPEGVSLLETEINSFANSLAKQLRLVNRDHIGVELSQLPSDAEVYTLLQRDASLQECEIEQRIALLNHTKGYLEDFLNGVPVWEYAYKQKIKAIKPY